MLLPQGPTWATMVFLQLSDQTSSCTGQAFPDFPTWYNTTCHHHHHHFLILLPLFFYWRRQWHPTPVLLPGKSHGRRSLEGCSQWGRWGSDRTEQLHFHFSLQCSCLENPRDGGAWWAAVYGVTQRHNWSDLAAPLFIIILSIYPCLTFQVIIWYLSLPTKL